MLVIDYFDAHPEQIVYLGTGSGFIFCGNRAEFLRDKVGIEISEIQMRRRSINEASRDLKVEYRKTPLSEKTRARLENRIDTYRRYCDEFIPYALREIIEVRQSLRDPDAVVIKAEGDELGRFYTLAEYRGETPEWVPNRSADVFEYYVKLGDAVVGEEGRRYARAISKPTTEESEMIARTCERWFDDESIQIYSQLTGREIVGSIRREIARRETQGVTLSRDQRDFIRECCRENIPAAEMALQFNGQFRTDLTWYDLEYLINRAHDTVKYVHFEPREVKDMTTIKKEISAEEFARYAEMKKGDLNAEVESTLSEDIVCGYGYYGAYISTENGLHYLNIRIGDSCD